MSRIFNIVQLLVNNKAGMTINDIAGSLNISDKTIRNDLIKVNEFIKRKEFGDELYVSLVMHIAISIKRLKDGKDIHLSQEILNNLQLKNEYLV